MFNVSHIISAGGLFLIAALIFGESGMFIGFFFPGDTLLLGAGVLAATGKMNLLSIIVVVSLAAILGDNTGYQIGKRYGRKLFRKSDGLIFKQEYINRAELFYERYGSKTMLFAHFLPVIRTFAPVVAGVGEMNQKYFFMFDAIGDIAWASIVTLVGYWFGSRIPNLDHYILLAVALVIICSLGPTLYKLSIILIKNKRRES
jgi:membrane-associated protein